MDAELTIIKKKLINDLYEIVNSVKDPENKFQDDKTKTNLESQSYSIIYDDANKGYYSDDDLSNYFVITITRSKLKSFYDRLAVRSEKFRANKEAVTKFRNDLQSIINVFDDEVKKFSFILQ